MTNSEPANAKERALAILREQLTQNPDQPDSQANVQKLAGDILEEILGREWDHQFDEDRSAIIRSVREVVELAVDDHLLREKLVMKIHRLVVENFGPFLGKHEIDLDVSPTAPVVVIHGENMRGKTTLQNAIRWCLYGQAFGRKGIPNRAMDLYPTTPLMVVSISCQRRWYSLMKVMTSS